MQKEPELMQLNHTLNQQADRASLSNFMNEQDYKRMDSVQNVYNATNENMSRQLPIFQEALKVHE